MAKTSKCFFCNKRFAPELGRWLSIIKTKTEKKKVGEEMVESEVEENIGKSFVCFQCETACSTPPEFNEDGTIKEKDRGY